jgi:hypothetical protein
MKLEEKAAHFLNRWCERTGSVLQLLEWLGDIRLLHGTVGPIELKKFRLGMFLGDAGYVMLSFRSIFMSDASGSFLSGRTSLFPSLLSLSSRRD